MLFMDGLWNMLRIFSGDTRRYSVEKEFGDV